MSKHKKKLSQGNVVLLVFLGLICFGLVIAVLLRGADVALLNSKGIIADEQSRLMLFTVGVMLIVAIPALTLLYFFAWRYRDTNDKSTYDATAHHGKIFIVILWLIPSVVVAILVSAMWSATHKLDPHKDIVNGKEALTIQVVALRWKWLFIYPKQNIATVNFVQIPVDVPVQFELTADEAPMSSFWIPHLGGQLYAMTGHTNRLNLMASMEGDYTGRSAEINGEGFAGMEFIARGSSVQEFDTWAQNVRRDSEVLDFVEYNRLVIPSENNTAAFYSSPGSTLYDIVLSKYAKSQHPGAHQ